jgi:hypothetical protein
MKKILLLFVLSLSAVAFSQETKSKKAIHFDPLARVYGIYPVQFGEHSLSKSHNAVAGFGMNLSFVNFKNLRLAAGFDRVQYHVTDEALVGTFSTSNYTAVYGEFSYEYALSPKISLLPAIGFGYAGLQQINGNDRYGNQDGSEFRAGLMADYRVARKLSLFFGAKYIGSKLNMSTSPEFVDYYGKATQVQLSLGLKIN